MSKAVKYYNSADQGAPQLLQTGWGHMVNLYRTLCAGYNEQDVSSINYSLDTKFVTINFANNTHGFRKYQTIRITDTESQYNNLDYFVISVSATSIDCTTKAILTETLDTAAGIKCKVSPLGMIHEYTDGVGKSAFRFPSEDPTDNVYLCINDTQPTQFTWTPGTMCATPGVYMCRDLTGIDGSANNIVPYNTTFPNAYKESEWKPAGSSVWSYGLMNILYQGNMSGNSYAVSNNSYLNLNVSWILIGNEDFHYLYIYQNASGSYGHGPSLYTFGRTTKKYNSDKNNYIFKGCYNFAHITENYHFYQTYGDTWSYLPSSVPASYNNIFSTVQMTTRLSTNSLIAGRAVDSFVNPELMLLSGINSSVQTSMYVYPKKYTSVPVCGSGGQSYPSIDGSLSISKIDVYEYGTNIDRGSLKGAYWVHHVSPFKDRSINKIVDENNREFYAITIATRGGTSSGSTLNVTTAYPLISLDEADW